MIDHAYETVFNSFSKKVQKQILEEAQVMKMMQTEREYAEALFTLATEENEVGSYLTSLQTVKKLLEESPDYIEFLSSPAISLCERLEAIDEAFEGENMQVDGVSGRNPAAPPKKTQTCSVFFTSYLFTLHFSLISASFFGSNK